MQAHATGESFAHEPALGCGVVEICGEKCQRWPMEQTLSTYGEPIPAKLVICTLADGQSYALAAPSKRDLNSHVEQNPDLVRVVCGEEVLFER